MAKIISIGKCDKKIIIPILSGFFNFILKIILKLSNSELNKYPLVLSIASSIGMSLAIFLCIFYHLKNKRNNKVMNNGMDTDKDKRNSILDLLKTDQPSSKKRRILKIKYYILNAFLDFIVTILLFAFCTEVKTSTWIFDLLFICVLSLIVYKTKIYRHHYVSVALIIIIGISLDIIAGYYKNFMEKIFNIIIKLIVEIIIVCYAVIVKYTMDVTFCSAYEICFWTGFLNFILLVITFFVSKKIKFVNDYEIFQHLDEFGKKDLFIFFITIICKFFYNLLIRVTLKNSNLCYWMIIVIVNELAPYILNLTDKNAETSTTVQIIIIIGISFMFLLTLVFNESIELNFLGLSTNTRNSIDKRASLEQMELYEEYKPSFDIGDYSVNLNGE